MKRNTLSPKVQVMILEVITFVMFLGYVAMMLFYCWQLEKAPALF